MTKLSAIDPGAFARRMALLAALTAGTLLAGAPAHAAGYSISASASPSTASGVFFTVTAGGGNREFVSVRVNCTAAGASVYDTVITVEVPPKGTATSQTIYPPASSCVATLEKLMQIGKSRVLATASFTVT